MNRSKKKSFDWYGMRQRFSIRKYHIGAASVLLGMTLVLSAGTIVSAETGVNGDGASNEQTLPVNDAGTSDGTNSTTQQQSDNQGNNSSGVQNDNTTNSTANVQPAGDTGSASGLKTKKPRTMVLKPEGDGSTNQPVADPIMIIPSSASDPAPSGYVTVTFNGHDFTKGFTLGNQKGNSVKVFVKNNVKWGELLNDPAWQWPTVTTASGDTVVGWSFTKNYKPDVAFVFDTMKDQVVSNTSLYPNVVFEVEDVGGNGTKEGYLAQYGPDEKNKWIFITFDAGQGQLKGPKTSKMVAVSNNLKSIEFDNSLFTKKVESPTLQGHTFVRWQTRDGVVLPKSGPITTETTYEALYLAHPQNQVAVFDRTNLTDSEKEQVKQKIYDANPDLSTGVPQVIKAIEISDTGEATVTFNDDTAVKVPSATLTNEDKATAKSNAKAEIEKDAMEKSAAINASNLTEEEKRARLTEVRDAQDRANIAIDNAATTEELTKALEDGTAAIKAVSTTNTIKTKAKEALEEAYNTEKAEIENSVLTADEKATKQAALTTAKENAIEAVDDAKTDSAVEGALKNGKATIESTYTAIIKIPSSASETAPQGYVTVTFAAANKYAKGFTLGTQTGKSVKVFVKNTVTWGELLDDPAWQWPTVTTDPGDIVVGWGVNISSQWETYKNKAFSREKYKDTVVTDTSLYPNVVYEVEEVGSRTKDEYLALYGPDEQDKWIFIKFDAGQGSMTYDKKQYTSRSVAAYFQGIGYDNSQFTSKVVSPTLANHTFVRWQTDAGEVLPKSGKITTDTTYKALYLAHPTDKTVVFDADKLTDTEKDSLKQAINNANTDSANLIQSITVSDTGEAKVTYNDGTVVTVPASDLINEDKEPARNLAKEEIDKASKEKVAEINASALTDEEKAAKLTEVQEAKDRANNAIDNATTTEDLTKAISDGTAAIEAINTTTSAEKAAAKQTLQEAYNAKKDAITNSGLTAEEKAAKQAELDKAKEDADKAIDAATHDAGVAQALTDGKTAIAGIDISTSAKKAQAKQDLETAYNAKKDEIDNSSLTAEEKVAKQAELDKAKADADKAIDAATDNAGVAKALEAGKATIDAINTTTSAEKVAAKKDLEDAYNAKKAEIENSALTAEEKAAKQAELDKAKADADKAIDAATDASGVAKALEAGKSAIDAINTTTSAEKAAAKKDLEDAYNAKKAEIANSGLTAEEKAANQAELDKAKADADKAIDAATDDAGIAKALEAGKSAIDAINTTTSAEKVAAKKDLEDAYNPKKAEIENSALTAEEKAAKQAELDKAKADADKAIDAATDASGVAKALEAGKSAIDAINTTTSAEKAAAKEALEEAYNAKKAEIANSGLTAEEKAAKQAELDKAKAAADKAIDAATDNAGVAKALEAGKSAIDAINTTTSAEKAAAKKDLEDAYNAKKAEIANSGLTAEEKAANQAELDKAKADADKAIDAATDDAGIAKALEAGKSAIDAINTTTSAEKAAAKKALEEAYNAKKAEIANSGLTAEEKAAKQAELDKAKADADKAIDAATDASGVAKALEAGKSAIDAINTTTSAEKVAAKKDLEDAYNAKKAEIENSALTAEEKAAKQAELDKAKADADKAIDAATDASGVAKALEAGKSAIDAINTTTSAKKAHKENKVLPKTGDNVGLSSVLGIAGLALLGTAIRKKRED